ncbi:hypothetical protein SAY87_017901 [Trapa incisa]|uniref:C2H2-type domain-containing protein n=1 Tax=Trapa incisa TaxID=236973 RepID=A0AAN7L4K1_9MYRT|nr:hypothetical protein SAY87_017901 [Trapa incisa]
MCRNDRFEQKHQEVICLERLQRPRQSAVNPKFMYVLEMMGHQGRRTNLIDYVMKRERLGEAIDHDGSVADIGRTFTCKTCNRAFPSFQALGGHRASHKRPRMAADGSDTSEAATGGKVKAHKYSISGLEFPIGQVLGGHMRKHRDEVPVLKKSPGSKRVTTLCLDLNLSPLENDLRLMLLGKAAPPVDLVI